MPVPVIASGGVGTLQHLVDGVVEGHASAVLAASIFHFGEFTIAEAKAHMTAQGVPVRPRQAAGILLGLCAMTDKPDINAEILDRLFNVVESRKDSDVDASYTAKLLAAGTPKIAQKVGEEAIETVIEALADKDGKIAEESADLLYHLLVLWADKVSGLKTYGPSSWTGSAFPASTRRM